MRSRIPLSGRTYCITLVLLCMICETVSFQIPARSSSLIGNGIHRRNGSSDGSSNIGGKSDTFQRSSSRRSKTERNAFLGIPSGDELKEVFNNDGAASSSLSKIWDFVAREGLGVDPQQLQPPQITDDQIQSRLFQKVMEANIEFDLSKTDPSQVAADTGTSLLHLLQSLPQQWLEYINTLPPAAFLAVPLALSLVTFLVLYDLSFPPTDYRSGYEPYPRGQYDAIAARAYYSRHPLLVLRRALQLFRISNSFIFQFLVDKYIFRDEPAQRSKRAVELLDLIQKAGPTAIKVGQALSVRPDIIPAEYAEALSSLQDRVPPFPSSKARAILQSELGDKALQITNLNMDGEGSGNNGKGPVASASIGQVYKGIATLPNQTKKEVAVKIQRPDVLAEIALDLYLTKEYIAPLQQKLTQSATDYAALANEWGRGFIAELDYNDELRNTIKFNNEMAKRNIRAVTAPTVLPQFSTERVLVTEWVDGTRLDKSDAADVPRLCSVALNAYLVMLLELSFLHCDPHPGNLLRTKDGRLCILDFGMTLDTDPTLQYSLLEFVAHLTADDFEEVPADLVKLGFLKEEKMDDIRNSGFLQPLTYMLQQAKQGGGGNKVRERIYQEYRDKYPGLTDPELAVKMRDEMQQRMEEIREQQSAITGITVEVEELQKRNRDAFQIPQWFLYTSRAFLTLEGICLASDEDYSIIQSCFPYVARRLLGDDSPRAQAALRDLLYGAGDAIDVSRLTDLADGFSTYTTTTKTINESTTHASSSLPTTVNNNNNNNTRERKQQSLAETEATLTLAKDSADILLAPSGNLVQNLLISESALATSAQVKDVLRDVIIDGPERFRNSLPLNFGSFLPPPPTPLVDQLAPFLIKSQEEEKAQILLEKIASLTSAATNAKSNTNTDASSGNSSSSGNNGNLISPLSIFDTKARSNSSDAADTERNNSININDVDPEQVALIVKELRTNLPKYAPLVGQLGGKFASTLLERASDNIEQTLSQSDDRHNGKDDDAKEDSIEGRVVRLAAKNLSAVATQGADAIKKQVQQQQLQQQQQETTIEGR